MSSSSVASVSSSASSIAPVANNLLANGNVEAGQSPWAPQGSSLVQVTQSQFRSGANSIYVTNRTAAWHGVRYPIDYLTPGNNYDFSVWAQADQGTAPVSLTLHYTDTNGSHYINIASGQANANGWTKLEGAYAHAPQGDVSNLFVYVESSNTTASYYVDDLAMTGVITPPAPVLPVPGNVDVAVNINNTYQIIDGFGAALPMWTSNTWSAADTKKLVGLGDDELGLSIVRTIVDPLDGNNLTNKNAWGTHVSALLAAQTHGGSDLQIMACPWTPPAAWKSNNATNNGGKLLPQHYDAYARYLNDYVSYMDGRGVRTHVLSIQNEPNWHPDYHSADWSGEEYRVFLRDHGHKIQNTKVMVGESIGFQKNYTDPTLNDAVAASNITYIAGHLYGPWDDVNHRPANNNLLSAYPLAEQKGKRVWMTEWNHHKADNVNNADPVGGSTIWRDPQNEAVWNETLDDVMNSVHHSMSVNWSAYVWWWGRRYYSFIGETRNDVPNYSTPAGEILKRGWAFSHYSKFVRPGYVRIGATKSTNAQGLDITTYKGNNKIVLVILNRGNSNVANLTVGVPYNVSASDYYYTSRHRNREKMTSSFNGQTVTVADVGPRSISTLVISYDGSTGSNSSSGQSSSAGSSSSSPAVPDNNIAQNGDAETGITNWGSNTASATVTRATDDSYSGSASVKITGRTSAWHGLTFNAGRLMNGNQYDVSVWVKLAAGSPDAAVTLTAKRQDDSDPNSYSEFTNIATITASASQWRQISGIYTQLGTPFEHFILESANTTVSFYADDFRVIGEAATGVTLDHPFFVGNITTSGNVRSDFTQYWNQITPENEGKWGSVEGTRDVYNWAPLDRIYTYARANNIPVKAHTFVWGSQRPNWIDALSPAEQAEEIEEWIRDYCTRYPDTAMIDVVNEATPGHAPAEYARAAFGNDWIIKSFQLARKYCPNAILILNDYNVLTWNTDAFVAMARPAVEAGVVDALGLQAHGYETWSLDRLKANMTKVEALGLPIYISEYDVNLADDQQQLNVMREQFTWFYNHPKVVGITLWGYVQGRTWIANSGLISESGTPRPAMTWLMNYLKDNPKTSGSCDLPTSFNWDSSAPLISAKNGAFGIKDPSIVHYNGKHHIWATINDGSWRSVYLNFTDWNQAANATQVPMTGTRVGNTVAPQIFYYAPHNLWYNFTQWGRGYSTSANIEDVNSWSARRDFLRNGPPIEAGKPELDYWVICDDTHCHLFFSRDDGVLYKSKTTRANFPNFDGYTIVMSDHRGNGNSFLFEAANVYKVDGTNKYLLLVEAYRTPGYGPRYFRSWTATSLDGPWTALADTEENPFAGEANVTWPTGNKWATGISHGEMVRSGHDEYLTIDPCNLQFLYQGDTGPSLNGDYGGVPYKLGLLRLKK